MSVVGFDFGNESCIVAVARQRGIDVVLNDESKCETPALVCFGERQRFIGAAGAASALLNPKNTISQIKRMIGKQFSDPVLQRDIKSLPFAVSEGSDGYPLIHARYLGEEKTFTPTQVLGMLFSDLKIIAEKNLNAAVVDCCIGIPVYFTDLQRRAVMDAAKIAGLNPLRLFHETTATALAYGIYKTDLPENDQLNVAFVDIGHASMQVCIAGFKKGRLKILAHSFDQSLGGRDFDEALFHHFAAKFKQEYKIDVFQNARACLRLRTACEKLKKVLSANPEAPLNIECLMEEKDVRGYIKRDEFEQISIPILERVKGPLEKALLDAQLSIENIHTVEVVGSGSRVPAIIKILTDFFKKEPRRTMNASECVARGCALQCAILGPTFKVREFQVNESFPFSISLSWKGSGPDAQNGAAENNQSTLVFPKGNPIPSIKALTFYRSSTLSVDVQYADVSDLQAPAKISTYTIGHFQSTKSERAKLKVKARLNLHGIVSVDSATLLEEEVGVPESGDKPVQMETDAKADAKKIKVRETNIPVTELVYGGMPPSEVHKAIEKEFEMALQDRVMEETKDKKNAVEAYVYDMRNKLNDKYQEFVTEPKREAFIARLQEVEDWLYEDGEDETKGVYIAKLEELKKQGDPIEEWVKEHTERGTVIDQLAYCVNSYREDAASNDAKFEHIDITDKQKVLNECVEAEAWLREKKQQQDLLPKHANPVLLSTDVRRKAEAVDRFCRPIMTKPKPAPTKPHPTETVPMGDFVKLQPHPTETVPMGDFVKLQPHPTETVPMGDFVKLQPHPTETVPNAVAFGSAEAMPPPLASIPTTASLPEFVREFGQIRTMLRSPRRPSECQQLQDQRRIFQEWMQRDFNASFSLKGLQDAEKALTELYKAQQMSKVQFESFLNFFENLRALRDQHLRAERQTNIVRCYKEKHSRTSSFVQKLVEEGSAMEARIIEVTFEIQKLEEQLSALKVEQMTLSSKLYQKIEEVKKVNVEVEDAEAQLTNENIALEEPGIIFTIMQTYHSRIAALAKDVKL